MPDARAEETPVEPDYGMLGNAQLRDRGPRYTETPPDPYAPDAPAVAEPWNMVTAAFFVLIAAYWVVRLRGRYRRFPFLLSCLPILLVGGVGGTLYHGLRTRQLYFLLDVIPISLLVLAGTVYLATRLWRAASWKFLLAAVVLNLGVNRLLFSLVLPQNRQLAINLNYATLAVMVVLPILFVLLRTRFRDAGLVVASLVSFGIAWFFRLVDQYAGPYLPMGSHWLWHTFGAASTALLIEFFYRVERDGLAPPPGPTPPVMDID
jgi:predicted membrane channel-forming protein YqfA (hemolysin III family)